MEETKTMILEELRPLETTVTVNRGNAHASKRTIIPYTEDLFTSAMSQEMGRRDWECSVIKYLHYT
jgi:hypothetical protein